MSELSSQRVLSKTDVFCSKLQQYSSSQVKKLTHRSDL